MSECGTHRCLVIASAGPVFILDDEDNIPSEIVHILRKLLFQLTDIKRANILICGTGRDTHKEGGLAGKKIISVLSAEGFKVSFHDPGIFSLCVDGKEIKGVSLNSKKLKIADCVIMLTHHPAIPVQAITDTVPLVLDACNVTEGIIGRAIVVKLGSRLSDAVLGELRRDIILSDR